MPHSGRHRVRVRLEGELDPAWSTLLAGLVVTVETDGTTLLVGELPDQAAVHGVLDSIRDLGLPMVSVETVALAQVDGTPLPMARDTEG